MSFLYCFLGLIGSIVVISLIVVSVFLIVDILSG